MVTVKMQTRWDPTLPAIRGQGEKINQILASFHWHVYIWVGRKTNFVTLFMAQVLFRKD